MRIPAKGADTTELLDFLESAIDEDKVLFVRVDNAKDFSYTIDILETETATWQSLGDFGRRCTVDEKKPASKRKASKPPEET